MMLGKTAVVIALAATFSAVTEDVEAQGRVVRRILGAGAAAAVIHEGRATPPKQVAAPTVRKATTCRDPDSDVLTLHNKPLPLCSDLPANAIPARIPSAAEQAMIEARILEATRNGEFGRPLSPSKIVPLDGPR